jgi:YVTN family beta-propeller protein
MVLALNTADLTLAGAWMHGRHMSSLGISQDGTRLYVVLIDSPRIAVVDASTGDVFRYVDGASEPWAILGVTSP